MRWIKRTILPTATAEPHLSHSEPPGAWFLCLSITNQLLLAGMWSGRSTCSVPEAAQPSDHLLHFNPSSAEAVSSLRARNATTCVEKHAFFHPLLTLCYNQHKHGGAAFGFRRDWWLRDGLLSRQNHRLSDVFLLWTAWAMNRRLRGGSVGPCFISGSPYWRTFTNATKTTSWQTRCFQKKDRNSSSFVFIRFHSVLLLSWLAFE